MRLAVIIPVYNRRVTTLRCLYQLNNIVETDDADIKIIVVDDGSTDGTSDAINESYPKVIVLRGNGNLWWTGAINKGVEYALANNFDYILTLNDDLDLDVLFLSELIRVSQRYPLALFSSVKLSKNQGNLCKIITAGFKIAGTLQEIRALRVGEVLVPNESEILACDMLTGASLLIPIKVFIKIGVFDSHTFPHNWGDLEFTRRASLAGFCCFSISSSIVYTEINPNYPLSYWVNSSRLEYIKNIFNSTKYFYGVSALGKASFMHRHFILGLILLVRGILGTIKRIILKIVLPNFVLRKIFEHEESK